MSDQISHTPEDFNLRQYWQDMAAKDPDLRTPEEAAALIAMYQQYATLRKSGWSDACYCPKDGSHFLVIEAGSTGVHRCYYEGEWPKGCFWVMGAGDLWPSRPILWKPLPDTNDCKIAVDERGVQKSDAKE